MIGLDLQGDGLFSSVGARRVRAGEAAELGQGRADVPRRLRLPVRDQAHRPDVAAAATSPRGARSRSATRPGRRRAPRRPRRSPRSTCARPPGPRARGRRRGRAAERDAHRPSAAAAAPLVLRDEASRTTYLAVAAPRAGRWRLTPEPGSSAVTAVRRGDGLPAPSVKARVSGRGHRAHAALDPARAARPGRALRRGGPRRRRGDRHDGQGPRQQALPARGRPRRAALDRRRRRAGGPVARRGSSPAATRRPPRSGPPSRSASRCAAAAAR